MSEHKETSEDTKTIVTVLLLIFMTPIGLIVMWFWPKWQWWVKLLVSLPIILGFIAVFSTILLIAVNPQAQIKRANCVKLCQTSSNIDCVNKCMNVDVQESTESGETTEE